MSDDASPPDLWSPLRAFTQARIGLGRTGAALRTADMLKLDLDCARARDAVDRPLDVAALTRDLAPLACVAVHSAAANRAIYLRQPPLGRRLDAESAITLRPDPCDLVIVVGDGLASQAVQTHAPPLVREIVARAKDLRLGPIVIARQARVALADDIGERLGARAAAVLIGERPGLTTSDSLGLYITWHPRVGRSDAERNCISNIHEAGLSYPAAADKFVWLLRESLRLGLSGVGLNDEQPKGPRTVNASAGTDLPLANVGQPYSNRPHPGGPHQTK